MVKESVWQRRSSWNKLNIINLRCCPVYSKIVRPYWNIDIPKKYHKYWSSE